MRFLCNVLAFLSAALVSAAPAVLAPASARAEQAAPRADAPAHSEALPHVDVPSAPSKLHEIFDIDRKGDKIGTTTIDILRQNDVTTVKVATSISVKVMFIEAYRYEHVASETWKGGQLVSYKAQTDKNGTKYVVEVGPGSAPDKLSLTVDGKRSEAPKTIAPASLWSKDVIIGHPDLFLPDTGQRLSIKAKEVGEEPLVVHGVRRQTRHYRISDKTPGAFDRDVWYDGDRLVRMQLLGSDNSTIVSDLR